MSFDISFKSTFIISVVTYALQYFQLSVYNNDGSPLTIEQLEEQLNKIVDASTQRDVGVGMLTSDGRNNWGRAAKILMKGSFSCSTTKNLNY